MPTIYLSPSTQQYNLYVTGGSEEQHMNEIADAMIPYLERYGINFTRNTPDMTAASSIAASNAGNYDFHLALHSNASPPDRAGQNRGTIVFYYPTSADGRRMAEIIANNFRNIYPLPDLVRIMPTTTIGEVSMTRAPSVLVEIAYHDNFEDATWIVDNINLIAMTLANSVAQYFGIPTTDTLIPQGGGIAPVPGTRTGRVNLTSGFLNIRNGPTINNPIIGMAPNGSIVTILGQTGDWYHINYNGLNGYVFGQYITLM